MILCRWCGSELLARLVCLKDMPLTDDFVLDASGSKNEFINDIEIFKCPDCGLIQNPKDFDYKDYYRDYNYTSGSSSFTKDFMDVFSESIIGVFKQVAGRAPRSVLEVGSGDGEQLVSFRSRGIERCLGVEPSLSLGEAARAKKIDTICGLFPGPSLGAVGEKFDICISSYTFDHIGDPLSYLQAALSVVEAGGLVVVEVHDFNRLLSRGEYCLLEHEHTIYLTVDTARSIFQAVGLDVVAIDPVPDHQVRANSLIVVGRVRGGALRDDGSKEASGPCLVPYVETPEGPPNNANELESRIRRVAAAIDCWLRSIPVDEQVVGFGAGGRGVMTLATIENSYRISAVFDSNHGGRGLLTPKTRLPVLGLQDLVHWKSSWVLVFSYGYIKEISELLIGAGFSKDRIVPLSKFYE